MASVYKTVTSDGASAKRDAKAPGEKTRQENKQRVLILSSRGVTYRQRHFLDDLSTLLPHGRKESKFDSKKKLYVLNELAELYNCNNVLFLEARKREDLYMHLSKVPNGPTVKFHIQNLHTMEELNFTGNCLKGSRPILSFDAAFDQDPSFRLMRELLTHVFGVPKNARKAKPFIDRVLGFSIVDGKIWVRHYQIAEEDAAGAAEKNISLLEIGPRFCMTPMIIQEGSFGGAIIYENKQYVSPNLVRAELRRKAARRHSARQAQVVEREVKKGRLQGSSKPDALDSRKLFA
ncbi:brix domain-containing protein 2 [Sodiomyces alkalinus F11]|uniref:Brix domain-containing protein 2 n=1 Tax=Sodiomyces alkalinus (strain CBS 110278 / VKM F-3762 / F11) TaxID=1314773 RepID=A0A3N2PKT2_SODAK|nr:brix domain-containing protein 2 [Sodiomyces alkalinus F11]ROT35024.1 brix domain-containing protein 2 [Sodiomyces alkalinus F11]